REQGNLFFYFPDASSRIKEQAKQVHEQLKDREAVDENLRLRNEDHPERGVADFFSELEELQQKERASASASAAANAGRPAGAEALGESLTGPGSSEAPASQGPNARIAIPSESSER
ncbi:unnamed protein product, partial [Effrenium voratum]